MNRPKRPSAGRRVAVDDTRMRSDPGLADEFAELCTQAVQTAALDLGLEPRAFAAELAQGEIGLLISYLREAARHVDDVALRARIDALLHRLTSWTRRDASD